MMALADKNKMTAESLNTQAGRDQLEALYQVAYLGTPALNAEADAVKVLSDVTSTSADKIKAFKDELDKPPSNS